LSIKLVGENRPLSAETPVNVSCRVTGAKPPPVITWWKDAIQMTDAKQIVSNISQYVVVLIVQKHIIMRSTLRLLYRANGKSQNRQRVYRYQFENFSGYF
jgi:hypothetical protein